MSNFSGRAALTLTLLGLLAAPDALARKRKKVEEAPASAEQPAQAAPSGAELAAAMPTSMSYQLEVLDAGAEPRRALRMKPAVGSVHPLELVLDLDVGMTIGEMVNRMDNPPIAYGVRSTVEGVEPDGAFVVSSVWSGARALEGGDAPPEVVQAMLQGMAALEGLSMVQRLDPTGRLLDLDVSGASPEILAALNGVQDSLRQSQVTLPEEPMGVGGRYRLTVHVESGGIPMDVSTTYTVRAIEGDRLTLGTEIAMKADASALLAQMPPGASATVDRFDASGGGEMIWDLSQLFPTGNMSYELHMAMRAGADGQTMPVAMDMAYGLTMSRAD